MTTPPWRLALAAGALVILGAIGGGLVQAATSTAPSADGAATAATAAAGDLASNSGSPARLLALRDRLEGRLAGLRRHLVHGTLTVLDRNGKLVTYQLDHGTVSAAGGGSITIAEAGGTSISVATTAETRVRKGMKPATLADLKTGDEVVVRSIVSGGTATAKLVVVPPRNPAAAAPTRAGNS
jgi:hypothetical protein